MANQITKENFSNFTHEQLFDEIEKTRANFQMDGKETADKLTAAKKLNEEQKAQITELNQSNKILAGQLQQAEARIAEKQARVTALSEAVDEAGVSHVVGKILLRLFAQK